ncbi:MAG: DUF6048 family protein [Cyclobacteriaceae bacterium]
MTLSEILKYSWISLLLLLIGTTQSAYSQNKPAPPAAQTSGVKEEPKLPKEKHSFKPTGLRLGTNLFRLGRTAFTNNYSSWDVAGDIDFYRYLLDVTYGRENRTEFTEAYDYESNGSFLRVGVDVNFIKDPSEANALLIGLKYVTGSYDEEFIFENANNLTGETREFSLANNSLSSRWLEVNVGLKVKMWKQLYAGFYFRYRLNRVLKGDREFGTYRVPGYGQAERRTVLGFDYYLFWRIPFKKSPKILPTGL